jgi:hypothetical protein
VELHANISLDSCSYVIACKYHFQKFASSTHKYGGKVMHRDISILEFADFVINPGQFPVIFRIIWLPALFMFKKMQRGLLVIMANHGFNIMSISLL